MAACFDIGASYIRFGASDASGQVAESGRMVTPGDSFDHFAQELDGAIRSMGGAGGLISVSLAGTFDPESGIATVANVPCLNGRAVARELRAALGSDVVITNDADCFALAEAHSGAARGLANVFGIILGSGVGGGVVINGRLLSGFGGISGEWGHGPVTDLTSGGMTEALPRVTCGCGRVDCLDTLGSARGLERIHAARTGQALDSRDITGGWKAGDKGCEASIAVYVEQVARPLSVIVNTLGCDLVPVGGGMAREPALIARLDARVRQHVLARYPGPLVVPGQHGADGGLKGAGIVAMQRMAA